MEWLSQYQDHLVATGAVVLAVLAGLGIRTTRMRPAPRTTVLFAAAGVGVVALVIALVGSTNRWGYVLALLPAVMILQHATFLRLIRMPFRTDVATTSDQQRRRDVGALKPLVGNDAEALATVLAAARGNSDRYFSASTLAVRYGTPAVAVAIVGITLFYVLFRHVGLSDTTSAESISAAKLGLAGAYVYILLYLGQRNFSHDVTSGGAMWCAVLLVVGPVLAWTVSHFSADMNKGSTSNELIYFASGLVPKHVASFLDEAARRLWVSPTRTTTATPRTIPITQIRGITPSIAERFAEERIMDLYALANADPLRLIRNTNFDKRQILSWIDEAILVTVCPETWQLLEKEGYTGAIDLAWLKQPSTTGLDMGGAQPPGRSTSRITALAERINIKDVDILQGIIDRLSSDAQLRLVWVLYQTIDQLDAQTEPGDVRSAPAA